MLATLALEVRLASIFAQACTHKAVQFHCQGVQDPTCCIRKRYVSAVEPIYTLPQHLAFESQASPWL